MTEDFCNSNALPGVLLRLAFCLDMYAGSAFTLEIVSRSNLRARRLSSFPPSFLPRASSPLDPLLFPSLHCAAAFIMQFAKTVGKQETRDEPADFLFQ